MRGAVAASATLAVLTACSPTSDRASPTPTPAPTVSTGSTSAPPGTSPTTATTPAPPPQVRPEDARVRTAIAAVRHLALEIGPRPGTTKAYFEAAAWVEQQLTGHGWRVERQRFPTPAGYSWNAPVEAGPSVNLVATQGRLEPGDSWVAVGAHLDTVPRSPGAEDNASGVGVLLAVAEALEGTRSRLPVVLIVFGSEEPRGVGDAHHHYGSRAYVASLTPQQRRSLRGMVSVDRVGVGDVLPVGTPADEATRLTDDLVEAARSAGVGTVLDTGQASSDHWSFVRDGLPGARLGGTSYGAYHSADDLPSVVDPAQLERTARTVLAWLG